MIEYLARQRLGRFATVTAAGEPRVDPLSGLPGDSGHEIARRQMSGYSGMIEAEGGAAAKRVAESECLFQRAGGLGGVESLISSPSSGLGTSSAGAFMAPGPSLARLSVGIENV